MSQHWAAPRVRGSCLAGALMLASAGPALAQDRAAAGGVKIPVTTYARSRDNAHATIARELRDYLSSGGYSESDVRVSRPRKVEQ
jgi:hypothetical protein